MKDDKDTDLHRLLSGIRDAHAYNAALLDAVVDAVIQIDERATVQVFNRSAERMFGWSASEVVGRNVKVLMSSDVAVEHDGYISRFLNGGEARIIGIGREVSAQKKNGDVFPIDLSVGEFEASGRRLFIGIIRDLSERKIIERALEKQQTELQSMFDQAPVAIVTSDLDGMIITANTAFAELSDRRQSSLAGQSLSRLFDPADLAQHEGVINALASGQHSVRKLELRLLRRDGTQVSVVAHYARIQLPSEPCVLVIHVIDRSAEIAAEREAQMHRNRLAHADRLSTMGELASGIAHEVNQPLTAISAYARACQHFHKNGKQDTADFIEALEQIGVQADRAGKIVHRLRNFASRGQLQRAAIKALDLVDNVVGLVSSDLRSAGIQASVEIAQSMPLLEVDEAQIQQVIVNLIRNAIESMQSLEVSERALNISAKKFDDNFVIISVTDVGEGVPEAIQVSLFEPFSTSKPSGMGLGLAIGQSIVQAHGGELWFEKNAGQGTRFNFTLPFTHRQEQ